MFLLYPICLSDLRQSPECCLAKMARACPLLAAAETYSLSDVIHLIFLRFSLLYFASVFI